MCLENHLQVKILQRYHIVFFILLLYFFNLFHIFFSAAFGYRTQLNDSVSNESQLSVRINAKINQRIWIQPNNKKRKKHVFFSVFVSSKMITFSYCVICCHLNWPNKFVGKLMVAIQQTIQNIMVVNMMWLTIMELHISLCLPQMAMQSLSRHRLISSE